MEVMEETEVRNCEIRLRENPQRRKEKVCIGCGAGFGGDRPLGALKLLQRVQELDYLVLECLAERTLADRYHIMMSGGDGYDSQISDWMSLLLPLSVKRGVCIITNMGAIDPLGAQKEVLHVAKNLGLDITVSLAYEVTLTKSGVSTYMGAAPIVECLEKYKPNVVITSRVADAALFLGPMVYELGWNWNDFKQLAQGSLAGHLLECGCQLTGGYFMHPGDKFRDLSLQQLLDLSLPYAEVGFDGEVYVAKANGSGGVLNNSTCAEQLLYEVGDPSAYVTPDVVIDFQDVYFSSLSNDKIICVGAKPAILPVPYKLLQLVPKHCGWKGWGEISYGGYECAKRAEAARFLVTSWMEEAYPGVKDLIWSYIIGVDSLKATDVDENISSTEHIMDIRLRMDGLFELKEHAAHFVREFTALYTNGPAGGGGISTGNKREIILLKQLVEREHVIWRTEAKQNRISIPCGGSSASKDPEKSQLTISSPPEIRQSCVNYSAGATECAQAAPSGMRIPLYQVAHSRAGDKGNDVNFSIIPHFPGDIERLKAVITPEWVKAIVSNLIPESIAVAAEKTQQVRVEIYEARGIQSLNVVVRNVLDGGVNCSRRIDRHGKTISDLILCQKVVLPPSII